MDILSRLLFRDSLMLVVDKPAGLPVHAGPGGGDTLEAHFDALRFGLPKPPALAHRLDRDTSGCLILGRHRKALAKLGRLFQKGAVGKTYWALCSAAPDRPKGQIDIALKKETARSGWRMRAAPDGQRATTDYRVLASAPGLVWIEAKPRTGRTHQIRVHLAEIGCPILGDLQYGGGPARDGKGLFLHSRAVRVPLYPSREAIEVAAPPPDRMAALLERLPPQ